MRMGFAPAAQAGQAPLLRTLEMNDSFGQHSLIRFEQFTLSPSLPASRFEFLGREGRGGGLLGRVLLVRRVVARAFECVSRV